MKKVVLFTLLTITFGLSAQVDFTNRNDLFVDSDIHSGVGLAVADMNGDRLDDMVRLDDGRTIVIDYQQIDGTFLRQTFNTVSTGSQWALTVADLDNNGYNDIMCGGRYDDIKVYFANADATAYEEFIMPGAQMFAQASNMADINNDGWLDAFVCHDDAESRIWQNMKDKSFDMADTWIDMATVPSSDNSGNYGSTWTDFDLDGDIDLHIAKCRQGVGDSEDPRRINVLFVNDGNGNFTEMAEEYGLKNGNQSWTADFGDIDNDGDFDCLITNHNTLPQLFENDGTGHFTEITTSNLPDISTSIQALFTDMDNDGFLDIVGSGGEHIYLHNNGDHTFTEVPNFLPGSTMESFSLGDLNHDGFVDINGGYGQIYTTPSTRDDILWLNNANMNNWIAFNLKGTDTNTSAVGTKIKIYGDWGVQIREVRAGESYGISNSLAVRFGLGTSSTITQAIIEWPSGNIQTIDNLTSNQYVFVEEAGCVSGGVSIDASGALTFCSGDSVVLSVPEGFDNYEWSNGGTDNSITVVESGGYAVVVTNGDCDANSNIVQVVVDPDQTPTILEGDGAMVCDGEIVVLTSSEEEGNTWSTQENGQTIEVSIPGSYFVTYEGLCGSYTSAAFTLETLIPELTTMSDSVLAGEMATLTSTGLDPQWYDQLTGGTLLGTGSEFVTPEITATTEYFVESEVLFGSQLESVGKLDNLNDDGEFSNQFFGGLDFEISEPVQILEFTCYANSWGERTIGFFNAETNVVVNEFVQIMNEGENVIQTDIELPVTGSLLMYVQSNAGLFSSTNPDQLDFPYISDLETVVITEGLQGNQYDYFYNLKFQKTGGIICQSDRQPVVAFLNPDVSTSNLNDAFDIQLFPNPTFGQLYVKSTSENLNNLKLQIFNSIGERVLEDMNMEENKLELSTLSSGIYFLNFTNEKGSVTRRINKL